MPVESQLQRVIELDGASGRFEFDHNGHWRFWPALEEKSSIERWLASEIAKAETNERARLDAQAENRETYSAIKKMLDNQGGVAIVPSPIARIPADQIIASTHNAIVRPVPVFAMDPYYDDEYDVLVPSPSYDPARPETAPLAQVPPGTPMSLKFRAEDISRRMEAGMNFVARERMNFEEVNHRAVDGCVIEGYAWVKTCYRPKKRNIIRPKTGGPFVDLRDTEEIEYSVGSGTQWTFVHDSNMLRPNLYQDIDDLEWLAERTPMSPDELREAYTNGGDFFLVDDERLRDDEIDHLARSVSVVVDEARARADEATRKMAPAEARDIDVREVWAYRWLKVVNEETGKSERRRFLLQLFFHNNARKLLGAFRNPYDHQSRIHTPFSQYLDGSSTVGMVKYNQQLGSHLSQSEIRNAYTANHHQPWYDPASTETAEFLAKGMPLSPETPIPGKHGQDWGWARGTSEHFSLLPHMQWNAQQAQELSRQGEFETRGSAPSHTSPNTVSMLLDRGGQPANLFLSMMNRGWRRCVKLALETMRQYEPLGDVIPVRDPVTKATTMVPFRLPIGQALDNFRFALTAADEQAARERSPDQTMAMMNAYQQHATFVMQPLALLLHPDTTDEQAKVYRKIIEGAQKLADRLIATSRVDEEAFNILPAVDSVLAEKATLLAEAKRQKELEAQNAANQVANSGGAVPGAEGNAFAGVSSGPGEESGVAQGAGADTIGGLPGAGPAA